MRITYKPNYIGMHIAEYTDLVIESIENKLGEDGAGLLMLGFNEHVVSRMMNDACLTFKYLNLSPRYTASKIIQLMMEKNSAAGRM